MIAPAVVYMLCLAASLACAILLVRSYLRAKTGLLFWTALCFGCLALNNLFLVADMVIFPAYELRPWRQATAFAAIGVLLFGFIREAE